MTDQKIYKARKSFIGAEGSWRKGQERPLEKGRGQSLINKGLVEEVTDKAVSNKMAPKPDGDKKPGHTTKPPKHETKPPKPLERKAETGQQSEGGGQQSEGGGQQSEGEGDLIRIEAGHVVIRPHVSGSIQVKAASLPVEPGQVLSVFARPDGSVEATADQEAANAITAAGGVMLDVIRVPAEDNSGNDDGGGSSPSTGAAKPSSSSRQAPAPRKAPKPSAKPKPAKAKDSK